MPDNQTTVFSREDLYKEIWEISLTGVSKKYNLNYSLLRAKCLEANIPIPPSGYWTKIEYGKPVDRLPLPEALINTVNISPEDKPKQRKISSKVVGKTEEQQVEKKTETSLEIPKESKSLEDVPENQEEQKPELHVMRRPVSGEHNTYSREKLYSEVWAKPVTEVALQYGVSDVAIHKMCKTLNVPVPPRGYWAKLKSGIKEEKPPLPPTTGVSSIEGSKTFECVQVESPTTQLKFLSDDERRNVLIAAQELQITPEGISLHKKIAAYKSIVNQWNKNDQKEEGAQRSFKSYTNRPPFLAGVISNDQLPRVYRILDALYRKIENLGGSINDDLSVNIRNEHISFDVFEGQNEVKHILTKQEAKSLIEYQDAKKRHSWASEPKFRKYDYVFNGLLRIGIRQYKIFKETEKIDIESKLGDVLIELYEESEIVRIDREAREEAARKKAEEDRLREERRNNYNNEIDKVIALNNEAQDYETACRIRSYIAAIEKADVDEEPNEKAMEWLEWAKKKADWYDPTIARKDDIFGKREHKKSKEEKSLEKKRYWW